jgi:hypothetical protein
MYGIHVLILYVFEIYRISGRESFSHKPLELLDFQACLKSLSADNLIPFDGMCSNNIIQK